MITLGRGTGRRKSEELVIEVELVRAVVRDLDPGLT
jgi:hypothetical protein